MTFWCMYTSDQIYLVVFYDLFFIIISFVQVCVCMCEHAPSEASASPGLTDLESSLMWVIGAKLRLLEEQQVLSATDPSSPLRLKKEKCLFAF